MAGLVSQGAAPWPRLLVAWLGAPTLIAGAAALACGAATLAAMADGAAVDGPRWPTDMTRGGELRPSHAPATTNGARTSSGQAIASGVGELSTREGGSESGGAASAEACTKGR